ASIRDAAVYVTHTPCIQCFKVLINTGIKRIVYDKPYKLHTLDELLRFSDVTMDPVAEPECCRIRAGRRCPAFDTASSTAPSAARTPPAMRGMRWTQPRASRCPWTRCGRCTAHAPPPPAPT